MACGSWVRTQTDRRTTRGSCPVSPGASPHSGRASPETESHKRPNLQRSASGGGRIFGLFLGRDPPGEGSPAGRALRPGPRRERESSASGHDPKKPPSLHPAHHPRTFFSTICMDHEVARDSFWNKPRLFLLAKGEDGEEDPGGEKGIRTFINHEPPRGWESWDGMAAADGVRELRTVGRADGAVSRERIPSRFKFAGIRQTRAPSEEVPRGAQSARYEDRAASPVHPPVLSEKDDARSRAVSHHASTGFPRCCWENVEVDLGPGRGQRDNRRRIEAARTG